MADEYEQKLWGVFHAYWNGDLRASSIPREEKAILVMNKAIDGIDEMIATARKVLAEEISETDWFDTVNIAAEHEWLAGFIKSLEQYRGNLDERLAQRVGARLICYKIAASSRKKRSGPS